jgi:hypothetical protein
LLLSRSTICSWCRLRFVRSKSDREVVEETGIVRYSRLKPRAVFGGSPPSLFFVVVVVVVAVVVVSCL